MSVPTREQIRATISELAPREQKIVGGMFAVMIRHPENVRDREWISEQFTNIALLSMGEIENLGEDAASPMAMMEALTSYTKEHAAPLLNLCFALFQRVAEDLAERESPPEFQEAMAQAMSYF